MNYQLVLFLIESFYDHSFNNFDMFYGKEWNINEISQVIYDDYLELEDNESFESLSILHTLVNFCKF